MATQGYEDIGSKQKGSSSNIAKQGVAYWGDYPDAYDTVVLAGFALPGLCSVKGKGYEMRKSHRSVPGKHGASIVYIANEPAEFVISIMLTTEEHLRAYEKLVPAFKPTAKPKSSSGPSQTDAFTYAFTGQAVSRTGKVGNTTTTQVVLGDDSQPGYLSVSHPMLALYRISHCRVLLATIPVQVEDKGMWQVELHCIEEVLQRKAKTGVTAAASADLSRDTAYVTKDGTFKRDPPSKTNAGPP